MKARILLLTAIFFMIYTIQAQIIQVPGDYNTIQEGINAATDGDTVLVAENTYFENIRFMGKAITVGSEYIMDGDGSHIMNTIIDGSQAVDPDSAATVMFINSEDTTSIINGFTITGGSGVIITSPYQAKMGGGVFAFNSGAKIMNNIITSNTITHPSLNSGGAGISGVLESGAYWFVIENNTISNNFAAANAMSAFGGGIYSAINSIIKNNIIHNNTCYNTGALVDGGGIEIEQNPQTEPITVVILNNDIQYNNIEGEGDGLGAGIQVYRAISLISGNVISYNSVDVVGTGNGGGIFIDNAQGETHIKSNDITDNSVIGDYYGRAGGIGLWFPIGEILISENTISDNLIYTDGGIGMRGAGILFKQPTGKIEVTQNIFSKNIAPSNESNRAGGAICLLDAYETEVIINANYFKNNEAYNGGGIFSRSSFNFLITNNVFDGNESHVGGGIGIYHPAGKSKLSSNSRGFNQPTVINNTFTNNAVDYYGGAIHFQCEEITPLILNSIFWENEANNGNDVYYWAGADELNISYCNIDPEGIYGNWNGIYNIYEDPGFTDTLCHISDVSPCFNAGIDLIEIDGLTYNCPSIDFDGEPRPLYGLADIGADEVYFVGIIDHFNSSVSNLNLKNYPNPFTSSTRIEFDIPSRGFTSLKLYDLLGMEVESILSEELAPGKYTVEWNATDTQHGIYYLKISFEGQTETIKLLRIQ